MQAKNIMNLTLGDVVHFHGARFEITVTKVYYNQRTHNETPDEKRDTVMSANGKWLSGNVVQGYFGPNKDWTFQGNCNVTHTVE